MLDQLIAWQRWIYGALSADLIRFAETHDWVALAAVLPAGVLFGAIHALTPGHGKSILASYLVGSRLASLRATGVAGVMALTHVGTAVLIAVTAAPLITRTLGGVGRAPALEAAQPQPLGRDRPLADRESVARARASAWGGNCGRVYCRACPVSADPFAMLFAMSRGVIEAGFVFAAAMMLGVLLTLATVALLTIFLRDRTIAFTTRHGAAMHKFDARPRCGLGRAPDNVESRDVLVLITESGDLNDRCLAEFHFNAARTRKHHLSAPVSCAGDCARGNGTGDRCTWPAGL